MQARQKLLSKVKADQERLKKVETRMAETKDSIESMKQRLADLDSDLNGGSPGEVAGNKASRDGGGLSPEFIGCAERATQALTLSDMSTSLVDRR